MSSGWKRDWKTVRRPRPGQIDIEHLDVGEVEALLPDVGAALPRLLERAAHGCLAFEIAVVEAQEGVVVDHVFDQVEVFLRRDLFKAIEELQHAIIGEHDFSCHGSSVRERGREDYDRSGWTA